MALNLDKTVHLTLPKVFLMQHREHIFTATTRGILFNGAKLTKDTSRNLNYQTLRYLKRACELLEEVKEKDWDERTPHTSNSVTMLAKAQMMLALASPRLIPFGKYSPDQPRVPAGNSDGGQWTSGEEDEAVSTTGNASSTSQARQYADAGNIATDVSVDNSPEKFDIKSAVDYLREHAKQYPTGQCANYVANAIRSENGGGLTELGYSTYAKNYGSKLETVGFVAVVNANAESGNDYPASGYTPQSGDVAVIQPYPGGNQAGHMAMCDGTDDGRQWISDFKQIDMWGGQGRRAYEPAYVIYRYPSSR